MVCFLSMARLKAFIWGSFSFCTMDGFFRILQKALSELICTRLYILIFFKLLCGKRQCFASKYEMNSELRREEILVVGILVFVECSFCFPLKVFCIKGLCKINICCFSKFCNDTSGKLRQTLIEPILFFQNWHKRQYILAAVGWSCSYPSYLKPEYWVCTKIHIA